jgi:serine/threonine-protein kinase
MAATMACIDEDTALALIEGRLPSASRHEVERHLESCDACRELCGELAQIDGSPSRYAAPAAGAGTNDTVLQPEREPVGPGLMVGPYRIVAEIGRGSAGTVYRAVDTKSGATVALKHVVDPALRQRFAREAATLARLDHGAIVKYVGHGDLRDGMYLAMEWLEGEDLQQRLAAATAPGGRGPLGWRAARTLGMRLAGALGQAHALGCIHRDLSPRNVFLPAGKVEDAKLLDFGLVRLIDPAAVDTTRTQAVLGTPFYMSPEQVRDPRAVDARSDLFGLGVLLYEVTTGVRPFQGEQLFTLWDQIVNLVPRPMASLAREQLPAAFVALVDSLLQKDPRARPASAGAVVQALAAMTDHPWLQTSSPPSAPAPLSGLSRNVAAIRVTPYPVPPTSLSPVLHVAPLAPLPPVPQPTGFLAGTSTVARAAGSAYPMSEPPSRPVKPWMFLALGALGMVILGTLGAGAIYLAQHFTSAGAGGNGAEPGASPSAPSDTHPASPAAPAAPAIAAHDLATSFQCVGSSETTLRGGHYKVDEDHSFAVDVVGCRVTLEDCDITGESQVIGDGELTLRRCQVHGTFSLVGKPTLRLDHTRLPSAPKITGQGRVLQISG